MDVNEVLKRSAQKNPRKQAVIFGSKTISYTELNEMASRLACGLLHKGIKKGEKVVVMLPNSWEFVVCYFGLMRLGAIVVPVDVRLKGIELAWILQDSESRFLIVHNSLYGGAADIFKKIFAQEQIMLIGSKESQTDFETIIEDGSLVWDQSSPINNADEALYFYTSGTTGRPKGVVLTFGNLDSFPNGLGPFTDEDDIVGYILPMSHVSGAAICNEIIVRGSTLCIFDNLRPDKIVRAIQDHGVTWFHSVPPIFEAILRVPKLERYDLGSLKWIAMMGTSIPVALMEKFHKQFPATAVIQGYGLTETGGPFTLTPLNKAEAKKGSVGVPIPDAAVKIVDGKGQESTKGETGEIMVSGPMVMKGYHNNLQATNEKIKDGWLLTGDIGCFDEEGFLYHLGRKDDMIITGGLNVFPAEIENVLKQHPFVLESAVVGMPDSDRGQIIKAAVVPADGEVITAKELISFCKERLASYKAPKIIEFRDSLPKTSTGKVARRLINDLHK